jgi:aldose 1-epimerase
MSVANRNERMARAENVLEDPAACTIAADDLEAIFLPGRGMLCASLRHRGDQVLGRVKDLGSLHALGQAAGMPLLHPWANRLAGHRYRAAGREVELDPRSPLLRHDDHGLPIHGVPWPLLTWELTEVRPSALSARLEWTGDERLAVFPFRHRLELAVTLGAEGLTVATVLTAGSDGPVPVSFGFHPYFELPGLPRPEWRLELPAMRKLTLDRWDIPTGGEEPFGGFDGVLGDLGFDDGFVLPEPPCSFSLTGAGRRITVDFLSGYPYAQVFAPRGKEYVALEPMTAPTNALTTGRGLQIVSPGGRFETVFRVRVEPRP